MHLPSFPFGIPWAGLEAAWTPEVGTGVDRKHSSSWVSPSWHSRCEQIFWHWQQHHGSPTHPTNSAKEGELSSPDRGGSFPFSVLPPLGQGAHGENGGGEKPPIKLFANFGAHPQAMHAHIRSQKLTKTLRTELTDTSPSESPPDHEKAAFRTNLNSTVNCCKGKREFACLQGKGWLKSKTLAPPQYFSSALFQSCACVTLPPKAGTVLYSVLCLQRPAQW